MNNSQNITKASVNTSAVALYASESEAHIKHLQEKLVDAERRIYDLTVDRDALRRQVDTLTHQVYQLRTREGPNLQPSASGNATLGKRIAVIDAMSDEVTEEVVG